MQPPPRSHILLVTFGVSPECDDVEHALCALGHTVETVSAASVARAAPGPTGSTAVLLLERNSLALEQTQAVIAALHPYPRVGIVLDDKYEWHGPVLEVCHEALSWPCPLGELGYRLERVNAFATPAWALADSDVLEVFSEIGLVGRSPAFVGVLQRVKRVAPSDAPVLIEGDTGTGKELVAEALHKLGPRCDSAFVPVNCGAIPDGLFENELFGHERGAFTGAQTKQQGIVELAHRGTLFLDEIESLSPRGQVVLLRFLQNREYRPLGSARVRRADVRVIVATNEALLRLVDAGAFRQDLYFRLNLVQMRLPPLCDRSDDIQLLARHFVRRYSPDYSLPVRDFHPATAAAMASYSWPGNIRELENFVHRSILLSEPEQPFLSGDPRPPLEPPHETVADFATVDFKHAKQQMIDSFERDYLRGLLEQTHGNVSEAARLAGKERRSLGKLLKRHGISRVEFLPEAFGMATPAPR